MGDEVERLWNAIQYLLRMLESLESRVDEIEKRLEDLESTKRST